MRRAALWLALVGAGCGTPASGPDSAVPDGAVARDMLDHVADLAAPDLATLPDLATPPDMTCVGLCLQQMKCNMGTTSLTGTVYAPNGTDPIPGALVYIPNDKVLDFTPGVACDRCGMQVSGSPLVSTTSAADGTFTLTDVPVGANIPYVVQKGRWRTQRSVLNVPACVSTAMPVNTTRLPRNPAEGDIPKIAIVTGSLDDTECILRKIGIDDSEFTNPTSNGRVAIYSGAGAAGAKVNNATPSESSLWGSQQTLSQYDMVIFECQGKAFTRQVAEKQLLIDYAKAGGRVLMNHYAYVWADDIAPYSATADWKPDQPALATDPATATIDQTFPRGDTLAKWLKAIGASTMEGQIVVGGLHHDFNSSMAPANTWLTVDDKSAGKVPLYFSFETEWGKPAASQCGRVAFSDFHVDTTTGGKLFPTECANGAMTAEDHLFEELFFDLDSCL